MHIKVFFVGLILAAVGIATGTFPWSTGLWVVGITGLMSGLVQAVQKKKEGGKVGDSILGGTLAFVLGVTALLGLAVVGGYIMVMCFKAMI